MDSSPSGSNRNDPVRLATVSTVSCSTVHGMFDVFSCQREQYARLDSSWKARVALDAGALLERRGIVDDEYCLEAES
jgi:hypothetical protein